MLDTAIIITLSTKVVRGGGKDVLTLIFYFSYLMFNLQCSFAYKVEGILLLIAKYTLENTQNSHIKHLITNRKGIAK